MTHTKNKLTKQDIFVNERCVFRQTSEIRACCRTFRAKRAILSGKTIVLTRSSIVVKSGIGHV